jgi:hypothetical protein
MSTATEMCTTATVAAAMPPSAMAEAGRSGCSARTEEQQPNENGRPGEYPHGGWFLLAQAVIVDGLTHTAAKRPMSRLQCCPQQLNCLY